ncbi:hypothetical protein H4R34_001837 [Dimargaris verticillata]|uniref:Proteasome complex subunit Rpn13 ubiquitin receptor-domain-containing protein n=1 Tax=Dimargaris verticillata TaxID=2761393 RepID=A0A9W8B5C2_9FUNG|nr:hypothetical protein H4R34_001837 [Dimargaris verticillata]
MATPLFSQPARTGHSASYVPNALLQFKAGRCFRQGDSNWVIPDPRKGVLYFKMTDDGLTHLCWKERRTQVTKEDLIVFPDEAEFIKCKQTKDRVYVLRFKASSQRLFFWMQSSHPERDSDVCNRVNHILNNVTLPGGDHPETRPRPAGLGDQGSETVAMAPTEPHGGLPALRDTNSETAEIDSDDNVSARATVGSTTTSVIDSVAGTVPQPHTSAAAGTLPSGDSSEPWSQLRQIVSSAPTSDPDASVAELGLSDVLSPEALGPILADHEVCSALFPYLPDQHNPDGTLVSASQRTPQEVRDIVRSPPFQQSLRSLSYALQTGQLGPLIQQLGLPLEASYGVENFLRAIESQVKSEESSDRPDPDTMEED